MIVRIFPALFLAFFSVCTFAASFAIAPEQISDLRAQRALLSDKVKELGRISKQIETAQSEKQSATSMIKKQEQESAQARKSLEKLQDFDRENPGDIPPEKLRAAEERNRKSFQALKDAKEVKSNAEDKINNVLNVQADNQYAEFLRLKSSFERDVDREVEKQLQERIRLIQVGKVVEVTERVPCGDDSIPVCKERSKKAAELKATERGSVVFVNSMTEVKNFQLSKEELRSEVQATLSDKVFSNQHMVGETEYETTIKASVMPVISEGLRKQMADGLRQEVYSMVGGKVDDVKNPSAKFAINSNTDDAEEVVPVKTVKSKAKPQPVVVEEPEKEIQNSPVQEDAPKQSSPKKKVKPTFSF